jgi:hypothetical protein
MDTGLELVRGLRMAGATGQRRPPGPRGCGRIARTLDAVATVAGDAGGHALLSPVERDAVPAAPEIGCRLLVAALATPCGTARRSVHPVAVRTAQVAVHAGGKLWYPPHAMLCLRPGAGKP